MLTRVDAIGLAVVLVVVLVLAAYAFVMAPALYPLTVDPQDNAAARAAREGARITAITTTRASILAALAGVGAFISIAINYRNSTIATETFRVAERGHLTDRYAKAIELLGDKESIAVRLGGIYALQQYAVDSRRAEDQLTVVEVLSAFVRFNLRGRPPLDATRTGAPEPKEQAADAGELGMPSAGATTPSPEDHIPPEVLATLSVLSRAMPLSSDYHIPPEDVLAAISVLAQLPDRGLMRADFSGIDFTDVDIRGARLSGSNLRGARLLGAVLRFADLGRTVLSHAFLARADLIGAVLSRADLSHAVLADANLMRADLRRADLSSADLTGISLRAAVLRGAVLRGALLGRAHLVRAELIRANLSNAFLRGADLTDADLTGTDLTGANLTGANLTGANLVGADLVGADLTGANLTGADLRQVSVAPGQLDAEQLASARNVNVDAATAT